MLLTIDIGNTNIVVGCFQGAELAFNVRLKTDTDRTVDEYEALLASVLERRDKKLPKIRQAVICSVVPPLTSVFVELIQERLNVDPIVVGPGTKTGMPIKIQEPAAVGADRVVNALAAKEYYGVPAVVIDFGTATSFDYVSAEGNYEGGIIVPGVLTSLNALVKGTAKLPRIELAWPKTVVGKSTVHAMQVGAAVGYMCLVDGLIQKLKSEVGKIDHIIATGGLGELFCSHSTLIQSFDPHLTLKGMLVVAKLHGAAKKKI